MQLDGNSIYGISAFKPCKVKFRKITNVVLRTQLQQLICGSGLPDGHDTAGIQLRGMANTLVDIKVADQKTQQIEQIKTMSVEEINETVKKAL